MTEPHDHEHHTTAGDEALPAGARRLRDNVLRHPAGIGLFTIAAALALFQIGVLVGRVGRVAFDGEGMMAAVFGATFVAVLLATGAIGVILDRRQRAHDADAAPLSDAQSERLRAYLQPASLLVRWYQPAAVAVFIALAAPGLLLLSTPWDGLWVIAVLVANPVARWLRAQDHVLTTRDLGFSVPGLSPWPSVAYAALAATAGMAVAVLLWADALDTTLATNATGGALVAIVTGGALAIDRHQRRHITQLLDAEPD